MPSILIPHYMIVTKIVKTFDLDNGLIYERVASIVLVVILLQVGHYLKQRDLATVVIRKHMLEKSQSHLQEYF